MSHFRLKCYGYKTDIRWSTICRTGLGYADAPEIIQMRRIGCGRAQRCPPSVEFVNKGLDLVKNLRYKQLTTTPDRCDSVED